jgi:hypothetical protein
MPSWSEILAELAASGQANSGRVDLDGVRAKYIDALHQRTGNVVIVYASGWLHAQSDAIDLVVNGKDVHALMEVCHRASDRAASDRKIGSGNSQSWRDP